MWPANVLATGARRYQQADVNSRMLPMHAILQANITCVQNAPVQQYASLDRQYL